MPGSVLDRLKTKINDFMFSKLKSESLNYNKGVSQALLTGLFVDFIVKDGLINRLFAMQVDKFTDLMYQGYFSTRYSPRTLLQKL